MTSIAFAGEDLRHLRSILLSSAPKEAAAVLFAGSARRDGDCRLTVREIVLVPKDAYSIQEELRLVVSPVFLAPLLKRARSEGWSLILAHSHPFSRDAGFSTVDDRGEAILMPAIFNRAPERPHGSIVLGQEGFAGRVWHERRETELVDSLWEVGRFLRRNERDAKREPFDAMFDRSIRAFGSFGQQVLHRLTVAIVGLGGTGSIVAQELAHLGVGKFILLDTDVVESTNLNRLVGANLDDVGRAKVDVAAELIRRIRAEAVVAPVRGSVVNEREARPLLGADVIFCCTDTHGSRAVVNQIAYQYFIPAIDLGIRIDARQEMIQGIVGRVQMLAPSLPCLVCQGLLDPGEVRRDLLSEEERARDAYIVGGREPQPAVISINGTVASLAVTMFLSATVGLPIDIRHQLYLADRGTVRSVESAVDDHCVVSSMGGALGRGDAWPLPWRTA